MAVTNQIGATGLLLAVACLSFCPGCLYISTGVKGSGVTATEERQLDEFSEIDLSGAGTITVNCGQEQSVSITIDDNLLELITTEVDDGELEISSSKGYSTSVGLDVDVNVLTLNRVELSGACTTIINNCETEKLVLEMSGAGNITVSGKVDRVELELSGAGKVDLTELVAKSAKIELSGASSAKVNATDELDVNISGVGSVSYMGNPTITKSLSGLGKVKKLSE